MRRFLKYFKKFIVGYVMFGLGTVFGAIVASIVTWSIMSAAYGIPDAGQILKIQDCLEERNE
tara:strand:+ start:2599 stop:2784 length:186 start_codon:yes stop_codon:yes gene_type:complete